MGGAEGSSPYVLVGDRALPRSAYRPSAFAELADTPAWWGAVAVLGATVLGAGALATLPASEVIALGGVALFLVTAVIAGTERWELATSTAVAGMVWTSLGISLTNGADPSPLATGAALLGVGAAFLLTGLYGALGRAPR